MKRPILHVTVVRECSCDGDVRRADDGYHYMCMRCDAWWEPDAEDGDEAESYNDDDES